MNGDRKVMYKKTCRKLIKIKRKAMLEECSHARIKSTSPAKKDIELLT